MAITKRIELKNLNMDSVREANWSTKNNLYVELTDNQLYLVILDSKKIPKSGTQTSVTLVEKKADNDGVLDKLNRLRSMAGK